jgi:hypothetical protein
MEHHLSFTINELPYDITHQEGDGIGYLRQGPHVILSFTQDGDIMHNGTEIGHCYLENRCYVIEESNGNKLRFLFNNIQYTWFSFCRYFVQEFLGVTEKPYGL